MLDKFKDGQATAYYTLMNAINRNKISHAYLFDSNGNPDVIDIVFSFVKEIISLNIEDPLEKKNVCKRIDDGNYLDVIVIEPDGLWLKKQQIMDLQNEFSKKAIEGKKKIYIIKSADKMNSQTANSILKFLEEPVDDIIAILIVDNINLVLPTIVSRCQYIKLNKKNFSEFSLTNFRYIFNDEKFLSLSDDDISIIFDNVISFIDFLERNGLDTLIYSKKLWHDKFKDRESYVVGVELMINFYNDVIKFLSDNGNLFFVSYLDSIREIASLNSLEKLVNKIVVLDRIKNSIKFNLNLNLIVDEMIIEMCGDGYVNSGS